MSDADEPLDPIGQCVAISFANHGRGQPGEPPTASLYEIVDAVRAHQDRDVAENSRTIRMVPDPRLIAAIVACRDYDGNELGTDGGVAPIVVMKCPRTGKTKGLICVYIDDDPEDGDDFDADYCPDAEDRG